MHINAVIMTDIQYYMYASCTIPGRNISYSRDNFPYATSVNTIAMLRSLDCA